MRLNEREAQVVHDALNPERCDVSAQFVAPLHGASAGNRQRGDGQKADGPADGQRAPGPDDQGRHILGSLEHHMVQVPALMCQASRTGAGTSLGQGRFERT